MASKNRFTSDNKYFPGQYHSQRQFQNTPQNDDQKQSTHHNPISIQSNNINTNISPINNNNNTNTIAKPSKVTSSMLYSSNNSKSYNNKTIIYKAALNHINKHKNNNPNIIITHKHKNQNQNQNKGTKSRSSKKKNKKKKKIKKKKKKNPRISRVHQRADVIADYLSKVPLLARLSRTDRYNLGCAFKQQIYSSATYIIKQGEAGYQFFIITKGNASVIISTKINNSISTDVVATLYPGDYFGETALLTSKPRNATVKSNNNQLHCLVLDKDTFINVFGKDRIKVNFGKRGAVSAETFSDNNSSQNNDDNDIKNQRKDSKTCELISSAIENNVLFAALDDDQINRIVECMWTKEISKGSNIINQGDNGDNFYVVESGTFNIYVERDNNSKLVATRTTGESFGELALMYNSPRSATVTAMTNCKVWAVQRYMFRKILIRVSEEKLKEYERFLKHVPLLDSLLVNERRAVAEALNEVIYTKGDIIVEQGEIGDTFYIIKQGEGIVYKSVPPTAPSTEVARLKDGSFFGERALVKNETRAATVAVVSDKMKCLTLDRRAFCLLLGPLAELMHRKIDEDYDIVTTKQTQQQQQQQQQHTYDYDQKDNTQQQQQQQQQSNDNTQQNTVILHDKLDITRNNFRIKKIEFNDLTIIGLLGKGSFGSVELVSHNNRTYALKSVSKSQIIRTGQQEHIISEKNVMMMLDSIFIVKLYETYNINKYLYFLLEVVLGGELFTVLRARTVFDETTAKFYTGSVVFAFDYMHAKGIIYRDLKPENLLLDNRGYLKITDFGFAKIINDKYHNGTGRTYTLCGTPDYLSPEVISGAGHGKGVDWWTLGVLLFEMLASYPPFYHEDPMKTYAKIMYGVVNYPQHFSANSVDIIKQFLSAKPTKRLGCINGGINKIKKHKWFTSTDVNVDPFNWDHLFKAKMCAPIIPNIKNDHDRSNFDLSHNVAKYNNNNNNNNNIDKANEKLKEKEQKDAEKYIDDGSGWDKNF